MSWTNEIPRPAAWVTFVTHYWYGLFLQGDALTFTLSGSAATSYEVRDYWGDIVQTGAVSGTTLTLSTLPLGWYRIYLRRATVDPDYGTLIGCYMFSILPVDSRFPTPILWLTPSSTGYGNTYPDHALRGVSLFGPPRMQIGDAENPTASGNTDPGILTIHTNVAEMDFVDEWYTNVHPDAARPRPAFLQFPNGGVFSSAQIAGVTATVAALYPRIQYFEGFANEPIGATFAAAQSYVDRMQTFYNAVKAGNPAAKVIGTCMVSIASDWTRAGDSLMDVLDGMFTLGFGNFIDGFSFHGYNAINGDVAHGRRVLDSLKALLAKHGHADLELWQTEWGCYACQQNGVTGYQDVRGQARWYFTNRFMLDQYGIPKERDYYFYEVSHSFWSFSSWYSNGDWSEMPLLPLMRVYSAELWGKTWTERLDFGPVEDSHYVGSRFTAQDGSSVLALIAPGRPDGTVTFNVNGASSLDVVSDFGTVTTEAVTGGTLALSLTAEVPIYVRVPAGVTVELIPKVYGPNVVRWGATVPNLPEDTQALRVVNGRLENALFSAGAYSPAEYISTHSLPDTVTVELRNPRRIDTMIVHCPEPNNEHSTFRDFDMEYRDTDGTWHILQTIVEPTTSFANLMPESPNGTVAEIYWTGRHVFVAEFAPVVAAALRVTVRATTYGVVPDDLIETLSPFGVPQGICLREIEAYCRAAAN